MGEREEKKVKSSWKPEYGREYHLSQEFIRLYRAFELRKYDTEKNKDAVIWQSKCTCSLTYLSMFVRLLHAPDS